MIKRDTGKPINWPAYFKEQALLSTDDQLRLFYEQGCVAADTPLNETPFVALDFETTGLDAEKDEIISIGLVPFDLNRVRLSESRYWLLKPRHDLVESSVVYHGITHTDLSNAPDLTACIGSVLEAISGRVVVVHYQNIERQFLNTALKQRLGAGVLFPLVDTMELEAQVHRKGVVRMIKRIIGQKPLSIRLSDSRVRYNLPRYSQHHALTDSIATAELLQAQIRHRYSEDSPISELWC